MTIMSYRLLAIVCMSLAFFIPSACGINIAGSSNGAGFSVSMDLGVNDKASMSAVLGQESISSTIEGAGDLKEDHWVANRNGAFASVGVDIENSTYYTYSYTLIPGPRLRKSETVEASESLDVTGADRIIASAQARNGIGYSVSTGADITQGSLKGYSNHALASNDEVKVSQDFSTAEGDAVRLVSTSGTWNKPNKKQPLWIAVRRSNDNPPEASIDTEVEGTVGEYRDEVAKSEDLSEISQTSRIEGTFSSIATADKASKIRTSNYGTIFNIDMQAGIEGGLPGVSGRLGYYIDDDNPRANRIQGAVDAAESGDVINVLPGTYFEHAAIEKSLDILGAGADQTVVDGQMTGGYIFGIGSANSDIDVNLSGMAIINAGGINNKGRSIIKDCLVHGNAFYGDGAGIRNSGTITVIGCDISRNTAIYEGGGIYNEGTATIIHSDIYENNAVRGGGIANRGTITVFNSNISDNSAWQGGGIFNFNTANISNSNILRNIAINGYGGGIHSSGIARIEGSDISDNSASYGGGINNWGEVTLKDSTISTNLAVSGGGIYTEPGSAKIVNSTVSRNLAYVDGGGIYNSWYFSTADILENSTVTQNIADYDNDGVGIGGGIYWFGSTLNFIDANGDGIVDPNTIVFDNYLGNGDVNNIEPPL